MAAMPLPLALLLAAVLGCGVAWTVVVPPLQVPDEDAHLAYVQSLVERGHTPREDDRAAEEGRGSTEQDLAEVATGYRGAYQRIEARPAWSAEAERRWLAAQRDADRADGGGENTAGANPPTYYAYASVAYRLGTGGTLLDRLLLMRLASVLLVCGFAVGAWLLAGELLGRDRPSQLVAAAVAALAPMVTFIGSGVTPDALVLPAWALALWLMVRPRSRGTVLALVGVVAFAVAVKVQSVALVPGAVAALALRRAPSRRIVLAALVAGLAVFLAALAAVGGGRQAFSYLWQFYVPQDLPGQQRIPVLEPWPLRDVWLEGTTGAFGWLEIRFWWPVYAALAVIAAAAVAGAWGTLRTWRLAGPLLTAAALVAGLHLVEASMLARGETAFIQGRYVLPLAPLVGVAVAAACASLRGAWASRARALALGGLCAWQVASLGIVLARFYA
jgi:hypothetical protein